MTNLNEGRFFHTLKTTVDPSAGGATPCPALTTAEEGRQGVSLPEQGQNSALTFLIKEGARPLVTYDGIWSGKAPSKSDIQTVLDANLHPDLVDFSTGEIYEKESVRHEHTRQVNIYHSWLMLAFARELLADSRTAQCYARAIPKTEYIGIVYYPELQKPKAAFRGLRVCGSVWSCPICSKKIAFYRARDINTAIKKWVYDEKKPLYMLTLTIKHEYGDDLGSMLHAVSETLRYMMRHWSYKETFKNDFTLEGQIRTLEVTFGNNGWHPHFHFLIFANQVHTDKELKNFESKLYDMWSNAGKQFNLSMNRAHGVHLQKVFQIDKEGALNIDVKKMSDYLSKIAMEFTYKNVTKKGKKDNLKPFELLYNYMQHLNTNEDEAYYFAGLFLNYASVFSGKASVNWSRGLRKRLLNTKEKTDQELAEQEEHSIFEILATFDQSTLKRLVRDKYSQAQLIQLAMTGNGESVNRFLENYIVKDTKMTRVNKMMK